MAVLILDVDRFKAVNDTLGHTTGDQLLRELADRLRDCLRPADTAARLGGDEFAVLIEDAGVAGAVRVAERIVERLKAPFLIAGTEVFVDVSTGIAESRAPDGVEELLQNADAAMYAAKREGKASYQVFEPQAHGGVLRILELGTELRRAVEREEFILHYQPVVTLPLGRLTGMEALVRWQHPRRGLIPPGDFIPVAEETGLIVSLDRWVLQEACRQARDWQARFPRNQGLDMHVNISARQLHHADLVPQVSEVLRETGIDPATLTIEITEGVLMQDSEATMAGLHALRELGVRLAIDDFGVGFSSLNYLRKLPVDVVKIDRSFVTGIAAGAEEWGLAKGIIRLVHDLGLETVAEGIEQAEQVAHLQALGCDRGQGYYFARPAPPGAIEEILDGRDTRSAIRRGA